MQKLSVIIPTLQNKLKVLIKLVKLLLKEDVVDEIIIINNLVEEPLLDEVFENERVRIYTPEENMFVNPSWNLGVEMAKNDKFLLLNDDILFEEGFCTRIMENWIWEKEDLGLLGMYDRDINEVDKNSADDLEYLEVQNNPLEIVAMTRCKYPGHWGVAIFGDKKNYYAIPDEFKIIFGDNYLLYKNVKNGKQNYSFKGIPAVHLSSSSSQDKRVSGEVVCDLQNAKKYGDWD